MRTGKYHAIKRFQRYEGYGLREAGGRPSVGRGVCGTRHQTPDVTSAIPIIDPQRPCAGGRGQRGRITTCRVIAWVKRVFPVTQSGECERRKRTRR